MSSWLARFVQRKQGWRLWLPLMAITCVVIEAVAMALTWLVTGGVGSRALIIAALSAVVLVPVVAWAQGALIRAIRANEEDRLKSVAADAVARLGVALKATRMVFWELEVDAQRFRYEPKTLPLIGFAPGDEPQTLESWMQRVHPDDLEQFGEALYAVLHNVEAAFDFEYRFEIRPGEWARLHSHAQVAIKDRSGAPVTAAGTTLNVTERWQADNDLREQRALLDATLQATEEGILTIGGNGKVLTYNRRFLELWRVPEDIVAQRDDQALLDHVLDQLVDPQGFVDKVRALYDSDDESRDMLTFRDGRIFDRYSRGLRLGDDRARIWCFRDVTERCRADAALQRSESQLRTILDAVDGYIYLKDLDGNYLFANRAVRELWRAEMEDIIGRGDEAFFDAATAASIRVNDARVLRDGEVVRIEETNTVPTTGRTSTYQSTKLPLRDDAGRIYALCGISTDITTRKTAEEALARSEMQLRTLIESIPDSVQFKDGAGRWLVANSFCLSLFGLQEAEWQGLTDREIGERMPHLAGTLAACNSSDAQAWAHPEGMRVEERLAGPDGVPMDFDVIKQPLFDARGERRALVIVGRDVTERKTAEAELQRYRQQLEELVDARTHALMRTEARASHILESSADGLIGIDCDGLVTFINRAGCLLLGFEADAVLGHDLHALCHHSHEDGTPYPGDECPVHIALQLAQDVRVDDEVFWTAQGTALPVIYSVHPMDDGGAVVGAVVSFVDVREQRAAAVAREDALAAAEALARVRREFLANMSHEIRTPLNGVLGFAQIGHAHYHDAQRARMAFERILTAGTTLLGVIDEILDFAKIESGKFAIDVTPVELRPLIHRAVDMVRDRARAKSLTINVVISPDLPDACLADGRRLEQVMLNLVGNAVKFTTVGGVTISALRDADELVFAVQDTGIGIDATQVPLLFNPFHQADASTTRRFGGTGLGLAISKRIVELMGGRIEVRSRPGEGSHFEFRIPYQAPGDAAVASPLNPLATIEPGALRGVRVLAVEDDAINAQILVENLREFGAHVTLANDGEAAVAAASAHASDFDVVLMDIQMGGIDGYEATRQIRQIAPNLPIIGQTAHAFGEERDKCFAVGMVGHIAKPIQPARLVQLILRHARPAPAP